MMLKAIRSSYDNWKIAKALDVFIRASLLITGVVLAEQAFEVFLAPPVVYAEESPQQRLPKRIEVEHRHNYDLKIRESLSLQKDFGNPVLAFRTLDYLFSRIKKKVKPRSKYNKEEAIKVLKKIGGVLKRVGKFEYGKSNLLIKGLKRQKNGKRFIDCDDYSSIYLAFGERLGLALEPVYTPRHVFLMCSLDDKTHFYWEPTLAAERDGGFYKNWLNIPENSVYPKVLNEKEFEAIHFCNLGAAWCEKGEYERAIECSTKAVELNPDYAAAYNNLGAAYAKQGNFETAIDSYKKAVKIDSNYATAYSNIGVAFYKQNCFQRAIKYFEKAIEVDPGYKKAYEYKVLSLIKKGDTKKALKFIDKINDLKSKTVDSSAEK